ncbi:MAG: SH3 domain-containing protein [Pseudomonadota bacterium]
MRGRSLSFLLLLVVSCRADPADTSGPDDGLMPFVTTAMTAPEFWIERTTDPDAVLLDDAALAQYNAAMLRASDGAVEDLAAFPEVLPREALLQRLSYDPASGRDLFRDGRPIPPGELEGLRDLLALDRVGAMNPVGLGVTVRRADLRMWPSTAPAFNDPDDRDFDLLQATALDPAEPLVLLHRSRDGRWVFVRATLCDGWLPTEALASVESRNEWLAFVHPRRFLVVTGARLDLGNGRMFQMGARLPLDETERGTGPWTAVLPDRGPEGALVLQRVEVSREAPVHPGYLPYTRRNLLTQAFRLLGEPYGWGGLNGGLDCSAATVAVYRSLGAILPRNSRVQEAMPGPGESLAGLPAEERTRRLRALAPGSTLHLPGHVMLFLGEAQGRFYALHALSAYRPRGLFGSHGPRVPVMRVVLSDLDLTRGNGEELPGSLTRGRAFLPLGGSIVRRGTPSPPR